MRHYEIAKKTTITVQPAQLNFDNHVGPQLELLLTREGKLEIELNGTTVRMNQQEVELIRNLLK